MDLHCTDIVKMAINSVLQSESQWVIILRYDRMRYIYVCSKADEVASLVWRTAQKRKKLEKKLKTTRGSAIAERPARRSVLVEILA